MANYLCLVLLGYLGGFLISRTLIEYPPPQEIYFRREFSSVLAIQDITRRDSLTWPVNNTCSDSGHRYKFSLRALNQSNDLSLNQKNLQPLVY